MENVRKVNWKLGIGILFAPYIFSWFTLRQGYSRFARCAALGWMALLLPGYLRLSTLPSAAVPAAPLASPVVAGKLLTTPPDSKYERASLPEHRDRRDDDLQSVAQVLRTIDGVTRDRSDYEGHLARLERLYPASTYSEVADYVAKTKQMCEQQYGKDVTIISLLRAYVRMASASAPPRPIVDLGVLLLLAGC